MIIKYLVMFLCICDHRYGYVATQNLPDPLEFLSIMFNTTVKDIITIAENFDFIDINPKDVNFLLYSKENNNSEYTFKSINAGSINSSRPTKIFIHGWLSSATDDYIESLAQAYTEHGDYNYVSVDWDGIAKNDYLIASSSCKNVGKHVGEFILKTVMGNENLLKNVHLIGHSLGAQVSGFAGKEVTDRTGAKVGRITALDAAAPLFEYPIKMPTTSRISSKDATYVDGIHTNVGFLGFSAPFATADFYINNGGPIQPGCLNVNFFEMIACSHGKSFDMFQESILTSENMTAIHCPDPVVYFADMCKGNPEVIFGENASPQTKGTYFMRTDPEPESLAFIRNQLFKLFGTRLPSINDLA